MISWQRPSRRRRERWADTGIPRNERLDAVGSLAAMPAGEVAGYVLVAVGDDGLRIGTDQRADSVLVLLAAAIQQAATGHAQERHP